MARIDVPAQLVGSCAPCSVPGDCAPGPVVACVEGVCRYCPSTEWVMDTAGLGNVTGVCRRDGWVSPRGSCEPW